MLQRFESAVEHNSVDQNLIWEVVRHLGIVKEEGTRRVPSRSMIGLTELVYRGRGRTEITPSAHRASELIDDLTEDDSQKWLTQLLDAVRDYVEREVVDDDGDRKVILTEVLERLDEQ